MAADILVGPTAAGKSEVAMFLARQSHPPRPILAADSMTVYRGMDIGTAKPAQADRAAIPFFGLDLTDPDRSFSAGDYLAAVRAAAAEIRAAGARPIVVGGTGLYVKCLTEGLDSAPADPAHRAAAEDLFARGGLAALQEAVRALNPAEYERLRDPENPRRLMRLYEILASGGRRPEGRRRPRPTLAGLRWNPADLRARIERRAREMFAGGLMEEVRALQSSWRELSATARQAIGYAEAAAVLEGQLTVEEAIRRTVQRTARYAKRQMTWFRHQAEVVWVEVQAGDPVERIAAAVQRIWNEHGPARLLL